MGLLSKFVELGGKVIKKVKVSDVEKAVDKAVDGVAKGAEKSASEAGEKAVEQASKPNIFKRAANGIKDFFSRGGKESKAVEGVAKGAEKTTAKGAAKSASEAGEKVTEETSKPSRMQRFRDFFSRGGKESKAAEGVAKGAEKTTAKGAAKSASEAGEKVTEEASKPSRMQRFRDFFSRGGKESKAVEGVAKGAEKTTAKGAEKSASEAGEKVAEEASKPSRMQRFRDFFSRGGKESKAAEGVAKGAEKTTADVGEVPADVRFHKTLDELGGNRTFYYPSRGREVDRFEKCLGDYVLDLKHNMFMSIDEFERLASRYKSLYGGATRASEQAVTKGASAATKVAEHASEKTTAKVAEKTAAKVGVKVTQKGVKEGAKTTEKVTSEAAKKEATAAEKSATEAAKKETTAKVAEEGTKGAEKTVAGAGEKVTEEAAEKIEHAATKKTAGGWNKLFTYDETRKNIGAMAKHPISFGLLGLLLYSKLTGQGMITAASNMVTNDNGLANELGTAALGKDKYLALSDELSKAYAKMKDLGSKGGQETVDAYDDVKDVVRKVMNEMGDGYQWAKNQASTAVNGQVSNDQGQYVDPGIQQLQAMTEYLEEHPQMAEMVKQNPSLLNAFMQNSQVGGAPQLSNSVGTGINELMGGISGGNVHKMDIASLMLSAFLGFGRFGLLGKVASLFMAGNTLHNMNVRNNAQPVQQSNVQQQLNAYDRQLQQLQQRQQPVASEETPAVHYRL